MRGEHRPIYSAILDGPDYLSLSPDGKLVLLTLKIMLPAIGIAAVPALEAVLAARTGLNLDAVRGALSELERAGWVERERNVVWIVRGLQFEPSLSAKDIKHRKTVARQVQQLPSLAIASRFVGAYREWISTEDVKALDRAYEGVVSDALTPPPPPPPPPPPLTASDANASGDGAPGGSSTPTEEPLLPFGELPPNLQREIESGLMGLVRTYLYCGRTPAGYDDARDVTILRQWLKRGRSKAEIADAIEGFAKARDRGDVQFLKRGERCTLRVLKNTKSGDLWTWDVAMKAVFDE